MQSRVAFPPSVDKSGASSAEEVAPQDPADQPAEGPEFPPTGEKSGDPGPEA